MSFDAIATLRSEGVAVDSLSEGQRQVLATLSPEETATLASIQKRVDAAGAADVEGHSVWGVGIF